MKGNFSGVNSALELNFVLAMFLFHLKKKKEKEIATA